MSTGGKKAHQSLHRTCRPPARSLPSPWRVRLARTTDRTTQEGEQTPSQCPHQAVMASANKCKSLNFLFTVFIVMHQLQPGERKTRKDLWSLNDVTAKAQSPLRAGQGPALSSCPVSPVEGSATIKMASARAWRDCSFPDFSAAGQRCSAWPCPYPEAPFLIHSSTLWPPHSSVLFT